MSRLYPFIPPTITAGPVRIRLRVRLAAIWRLLRARRMVAVVFDDPEVPDDDATCVALSGVYVACGVAEISAVSAWAREQELLARGQAATLNEARSIFNRPNNA